MPFVPENFFRNLAKYPELLQIIDDLTMNSETQEKGGKDDLQDLADQIKKRKFDFGTWQERLQEVEGDEKLRAKWLSFWIGFSGDEDLQQINLIVMEYLNPATVEIYKIMGRKFRRLFEQIPAQDQREIHAGLVRYVYLIAKRHRITCTCGTKYYVDVAVNSDDEIRCPECNRRFPDFVIEKPDEVDKN